MTDTTLTGVMKYGTHAARPLATAVAVGTIYAESDTYKAYQSDGSAWNLWLDGSTGSGTTPVAAGARVYNSAAETCTTSVAKVLAFDTERFDTDAYHDTVTNNSRLTVPTGKDGYYVITGSVRFAANATGQRLLFVQLNGTTALNGTRINAASTSVTEISVSTIYHLVATDYVELVAYQTSGGNLDVSISSNNSPEFSMLLIGT